MGRALCSAMVRTKGRASLAIVLAGGAARGAYEVGVLEHLVGKVANDVGRELRIDILCGTSVGALNACGLAAHADLSPRARVARLATVWSELELGEMLALDTRGILSMASRLLGRRGDGVPVREAGLLDPKGLERVVARSIPFERIDGNLRRGHLGALTVSTTHVASGRTVVFVQRAEEGLPPWSHDPTIEPRAARIGAWHALASAAIPILFRAVRIDGEFHCDGGLRQNVPLSPARRLGASHLLVINPRALPTTPLGEGSRDADDFFPDPLFLLGKTLNALLLDRIDTDIARLRSINRIVDAGTRAFGDEFLDKLNAALGAPHKTRGIAPLEATLVRASKDIGKLAAEHARTPRFAARVRGATGRVLRAMAERDARSESDLLSYVLFDGEFARALLELGRADAAAQHDELCRLVEHTLLPTE
jgi:NTE family protein